MMTSNNWNALPDHILNACFRLTNEEMGTTSSKTLKLLSIYFHASLPARELRPSHSIVTPFRKQ